MTHHSRSLLLSLVVAALALPGVASAEGRLQTVLDRGHLIVGTGSTNAPWHFVDENGELKGFDIEISKIIAKGLFEDASKVEFVDQSADARIPNLVTDKVDIVCQFMTITPQRALQVDFTLPYYREGVGLMLMANGKYKTYDELKAAGSAVTVSVLQNVFAEDWVHMALPEAKVDQYDSVATAIQATASGRADTASVDVSNLYWMMKQQPGIYIDAGYHWQPNSYACAVKKGDQEWLNWVNTALHEAMTGVDFTDYAKAYEAYFGEKLDPPAIGMPLEYR